MAETSTVPWVVGVFALLDERASVDRVVVGVLRLAGARRAMFVLAWLVALAHGVGTQYRALEHGVVLLVVAALAGCAAALLCSGLALGAAARLDWLGASFA